MATSTDSDISTDTVDFSGGQSGDDEISDYSTDTSTTSSDESTDLDTSSSDESTESDDYGSDFRSLQSDEDDSSDYFDGEEDDEAESSLSKRQKLETLEEEDRISQLPDSILVDIISLLRHTGKAAETSVLSKRWRCLWTSVPNLVFYQGFEEPISKFVSDVSGALIQCRHSKLEKFRVFFADYEPGYASEVNKWIQFAVRCNVEDLDLTFGPSRWRTVDDFVLMAYKVPDYLLMNSCLTNLRLLNCLIPNKGLPCWKMLKKLSIGAHLTEDVIQSILFGCPVLETLVLDQCYGFSRLDTTSSSVKLLVIDGYCPRWRTYDPVVISAPNVSSLHIRGAWIVFRPLHLDVPPLVKLVLDFDFDEPPLVRVVPDFDFDEDDLFIETFRNMWKEFFENLPPVHELTIGDRPLQVLSHLEMDGWRIPLLKCKCLKMNFIKRSYFPGLANLLRSSPDLESLLINADSPLIFGCTGSHTRRNYLMYRKRDFHCLRHNLKLVKIYFSIKWDHECEVVQFLLENACVLEKIFIKNQTHWWKSQSSTYNELFMQAAEKFYGVGNLTEVVCLFIGRSLFMTCQYLEGLFARPEALWNVCNGFVEDAFTNL